MLHALPSAMQDVGTPSEASCHPIYDGLVDVAHDGPVRPRGAALPYGAGPASLEVDVARQRQVADLCDVCGGKALAVRVHVGVGRLIVAKAFSPPLVYMVQRPIDLLAPAFELGNVAELLERKPVLFNCNPISMASCGKDSVSAPFISLPFNAASRSPCHPSHMVLIVTIRNDGARFNARRLTLSLQPYSIASNRHQQTIQTV